MEEFEEICDDSDSEIESEPESDNERDYYIDGQLDDLPSTLILFVVWYDYGTLRSNE